MLRKKTITSDDKKRKIVFTEIECNKCKIELLSENNCQMELITQENVFLLDRSKKQSRGYMKLIYRYMEEDISMYALGELLEFLQKVNNGGRRHTCFEGKIFFERGMISFSRGIKWYHFCEYTITVGDCMEIVTYANELWQIKIRELNNMEYEELFRKYHNWSIRYNGEFRTNYGEDQRVLPIVTNLGMVNFRMHKTVARNFIEYDYIGLLYLIENGYEIKIDKKLFARATRQYVLQKTEPVMLGLNAERVPIIDYQAEA